jgi:molecular chaperone DnaK
MVRDAESNAEADAKRKEGIELKNEIDSMSYSTEKTLKEHADKIPEDVKAEVETAIKEANEAKEGDDVDLIKEKKEALTAATSKIGQAIYGQGQGAEGGAEGAAGEEKKDDTVDAEFEDKKEEKK